MASFRCLVQSRPSFKMGEGAVLIKPEKTKVVTAACLSSLVCLLVYLPALFCDFINWDDPHYITNNPAIRLLDWQFIREAFTTSYMGWWMPLTWISFAIDYHFWVLDPFGYHLTNVLLHAANTGLVVLVADGLLGQRQRTGAGGSYLYPAILLLAGLLWGLHPLRVESVAWVTERKDVLNGIFSLAAILCYVRYVHEKDSTGYSAPAIRYYVMSLLLLLLSLMSKPISVVMPAMLLVADWYPLRRFRKETVLHVLLEKVPFVIMVVVVSLATIHFAAGNQILVSYSDLPLLKRFVLAGNSLFEYCFMSLYPVDIIHIYLLPWPFPLSYTIKSLVIACFSAFCVWSYRKNPWLSATWIAFVLPLVPVLGFFQNGAQSHAARFMYLPGVAPSICVAALSLELYGLVLSRCPRFLRALTVAIVAVLLIYSVTTLRHLAAWKNPETLWSRAIAIRPVGRAYYLRASYFLIKGRYLEAADDLQKSIELGNKAGFTGMFNLYAARGDALNKAEKYEEAVQEFTKAIQLNPYPEYFYHRGLAFKGLGRIKDAESDFFRAGDRRGEIEWQKNL